MIKKINKKIIAIFMILITILNISVPAFATLQIGDTSHLYGEKELPGFFRNKGFRCNQISCQGLS